MNKDDRPVFYLSITQAALLMMSLASMLQSRLEPMPNLAFGHRGKDWCWVLHSPPSVCMKAKREEYIKHQQGNSRPTPPGHCTRHLGNSNISNGGNRRGARPKAQTRCFMARIFLSLLCFALLETLVQSISTLRFLLFTGVTNRHAYSVHSEYVHAHFIL